MKKISKAIAVGGPVAVGKSSLVGAIPFKPVLELEPNDQLQHLLLQRVYEGDKIAAQIFQVDMLVTRFNKYKELANSEPRHVFDRLIFEDYYFAKKLLVSTPNAWNYYLDIWNDAVDQMINEIGLPELYIFLTCSWETFQKRIFDRNRVEEISNYEKNVDYFKTMIQEYDAHMMMMFEKYNIDYVIINTDNLSKLDVVRIVDAEFAKRGIK